MEKSEADLSKDKNQRAIETAEAQAQQLQAALRVTTARLKENAADFLHVFTPKVHAAVLGFARAEAKALRDMAARTDHLLDHKLTGWDAVRDIRRAAAEAELTGKEA